MTNDEMLARIGLLMLKDARSDIEEAELDSLMEKVDGQAPGEGHFIDRIAAQRGHHD